MTKRAARDDSPWPTSWIEFLKERVKPPVCIALGSPRQAAGLLHGLQIPGAVAWQLDHYQADRLREDLDVLGCEAEVRVEADLWDLEPHFQSVVFPVEPRGERQLKLDVVDQAQHILLPQGAIYVLSRREREQLFPAVLKKIYGRVHMPQLDEESLLWAQRPGDKPRRRHELTFHISNGDKPSLRFLSRPGVFAFGRFDNGARALMELAEVRESDRILDLGCGCGTNGVIAGLRAGAKGHVTFVDSNVRATALTRLNAEANGLSSFEVHASANLDPLQGRKFDLVLTNPPYFASLGIARRFIEQASPLVADGGRMYLVTKTPQQVGEMLAEHFGFVEAFERRGYVVLAAMQEE